MSVEPFAKGLSYLSLPKDPHVWLIEDLIPTNGLVNLYASPKVGKSFAALGMAIGISDPACRSYLGFPILKHGPVAYLQIDTPRTFWAARIEKIVKESKANIENVYFADRLMAPKGFSLTNHESKVWFETEISRINPVCVVIDTLRESHDQDEDSATDMKKVISIITECVPQSAIIFVSHSRKSFQNMSEEMGNIMDDVRGSGYVSGRMDCVCKMTKKLFAYQSRAGKGEFAIQQKPTTGEIRRLFTERSLLDYLKYLKERNPEMSPEQHIDIVLETTDISREIAINKYNQILKEREEEGKIEITPEMPGDLQKALKSLKDMPND